MAEQTRDTIEYDRLSEYLKALSNPNRLEILYQTRFPRAAAEIRVTPKRSEAGGNPDRYISRQAVDRHLGILEGIGVVRRQRGAREGRPVDEYVVNHPKLFAIVEEIKKITHIQAHDTVDALATLAGSGVTAPRTLPEGKRAPAPDAPHLRLVAGVFEGRAYPLHGHGPWRIGRSDEAEVRLDYDPFVSSENSRITQEDGKFTLHDSASSRNGTSVNYAPIPRGESVTLHTGDLVGVGRSILMFRAP